MEDTLFIGDYAFSSWSMRGWLLFRNAQTMPRITRIPFENADVAAQMSELVPSRTVPTFVTASGAVIWDSLALAEEMASRAPELKLWPAEPDMRAMARSLAAEMHSGFGALRSDCPMNLRCAYTNFTPSPDVEADLRRLETIWAHALATSGGPWLCGDYTVADAFFAPVAGRIAGYGLKVDAAAGAYVAQHLADPAFRRWRAMGLVHGADLPWYARDYAQKPWPGPSSLPARAVTEGTPINAACPYSGKPTTDLARIEDHIYGFCNPFCRDKTVADAEAWPQFMALRNAHLS